MKDYFYHGPFYGVSAIKAIFETGAILSSNLFYDRKHLDKKDIGNYSGYNGIHYISICEKASDEEYEKNHTNAFYSYICCKPCIVIKKDINAVKTILLDEDDMHPTRYYGNLDNGERYSDMFDEYQVRNRIEIEDFVAIGYPFSYEMRNIEAYKQDRHYKIYKQEILDDLYILKQAIKESKLNLPIIDSSSPKQLLSRKKISRKY